MTPRKAAWPFVLLFVATPFYQGVCADRSGAFSRNGSREVPRAAGPTEDRISGLISQIEAAREHFRPLDAGDVRRQREDVVAAFARLDARLRRAGEVGQGWRDYLYWETLRAALEDPEPDIEFLGRTLERLSRDYATLRLVWFVEVRRALERYLTVVGLVGVEDLELAYGELLDDLAAALSEYARRPDPQSAAQIGAAVAWLEMLGQAEELVAAVRRTFQRPNLYVRTSGELLGAAVADDVDDVAPISEIIRGALVCGVGRTRGSVSVELIPAAERAVVDAVFRLVTESDNVGHKGPVQVFSRGTTRVDARKRLQIEPEQVSALPARSSATTRTQFDAVRALRGGRLVERFAWRQAYRDQFAAEWEASRKAERRVNHRIDAEVGERLAEANATLRARILRPLRQRRLFPEDLRFRTTTDALHAAATSRDDDQIAAADLPPRWASGGDLGIKLHQSMVNNLTATAFAGQTVHEEQLVAELTDLLGFLPANLALDEMAEPWALTFAGTLPISVLFAEETVTVTVRAVDFFRGGARYPGMHVTASYRIEPEVDGFRAVLAEELTVLPPGFDPAAGDRLSARQQTIRTLLMRRFERVFPPEMALEPIALGGPWERAGVLDFAQVTAENGWLVLTLRRRETPEDLTRRLAGAD